MQNSVSLLKFPSSLQKQGNPMPPNIISIVTAAGTIIESEKPLRPFGRRKTGITKSTYRMKNSIVDRFFHRQTMTDEPPVQEHSSDAFCCKCVFCEYFKA